MSKLAKALTAAAGNAGESLYVEDVFSTYLYDGTGADQTITNGINLSEEGGLVWLKDRGPTYTGSHSLMDTERGGGKIIESDTADAEADIGGIGAGVTFNSDGFVVKSNYNNYNRSGEKIVSWSFRKAEKFFDVVTFSTVGDGTAQSFSHNLGSVPAVMIVKKTSSNRDWFVYHKDLNGGINPEQYYLQLNGTNAEASSSIMWANTAPTSTQFTLGGVFTNSGNEGDFVAYLFASDAGGFGDDDENIIKCGSYTGNGSTDGPTIDCGFEPQWLLIKNTTNGGNWVLMDAMRGMPVGDEATVLLPNANGAESSYANLWGVDLQANGFKVNVSQIQINESGGTMVYIAIRRPMKTPESGTEVFSPVAYSGNSTAGRSITSGFPLDAVFTKGRNAAIEPILYSRLQGSAKKLLTYSASAEASSSTNVITSFDQDGMTVGTDADINNSSYTYINYFLKRATGFFDVVAYTGDGTTPRDIDHNLAAVPEFIVTKRRNVSGSWAVYHPDLGITSTSGIRFNSSDGSGWSQLTRYPSTPTSSVYTVGTETDVNASGSTYISYLWTTLAGVSKVGSYTGTGADLNVDCGFSAGARFVMIKRYGTSTTGDWYVYDSARGIVAGNDPYLLLNSTAAEVTSTDYIDPLNAGFTVTSSAPAALNASGGTYIFLAIA